MNSSTLIVIVITALLVWYFYNWLNIKATTATVTKPDGTTAVVPRYPEFDGPVAGLGTDMAPVTTVLITTPVIGPVSYIPTTKVPLATGKIIM